MRFLDEPEATCAALIDDLIEKVWPQDGPIPWRDADEYRMIVERLDRIPPAMRAPLGVKLVMTLNSAIAAGARRSFLVLDTSQNARLLFVCDVLHEGEREDRLMAEIALLANVRQHQASRAALIRIAPLSPSGFSTAKGGAASTPSRTSVRHRSMCPMSFEPRSSATTAFCAASRSHLPAFERAAQEIKQHCPGPARAAASARRHALGGRRY